MPTILNGKDVKQLEEKKKTSEVTNQNQRSYSFKSPICPVTCYRLSFIYNGSPGV